MKTTLLTLAAVLCAVVAQARTFDITLWKGETAHYRLPDSAELGEKPDGICLRTGMLREVKYLPDLERLAYGVAADRVEWCEPKGPGIRVIEVSAAPDAKPGVYTCGMVRVTVIDRVLPPPAQWKYVLDLWQHPWAVARVNGLKPFSPAHYDAMRPLWKLLADAGQKYLTVTLLDQPWNHQCRDAYRSMIVHRRDAEGKWTFDYSLFDEYVAFGRSCGLGPGIACYTMCPWGNVVTWVDENGVEQKASAPAGSQAFKEYWGDFLVDFAKHLKEKGWYDDTYIAMDERSREEVMAIANFVRERAPGLKISMAGNRAPSEFEGIRINSYCQALDWVREPSGKSKFLAEVPARRAAGDITTFYVCCGPAVPNTFLGSREAEAFWLGYFPVANGLDGFLRWAYNSWPEDAMQDGTYGPWKGGDTYLVYPNGAPSWRFLMLRAGIVAAEKSRILREWGLFTKEFAENDRQYVHAEAQKPGYAFDWLMRQTLALVNRPDGYPPLPKGTLVEAEAFEDVGGWSVDQQFMDQMGSSFLLAHGLGKPVAEAKTRVKLPSPGTYRLWVRTRDWVAPHGAGEFRVLVGGKSAGTFGKGGSGVWEWWKGETIEARGEGQEVEVVIRDLTGYEGRVDALFFSCGAEGLPPPNGTDYAWRRQLRGLPEVAPVAGEFDFCVVGGGFAGMCAAVAAAREGLRVALVQDRPVFGGNGSTECRVVPQGKWGTGPFPNNRKIMEEFRALIPKHQGPAWEDNYKPDSAAWERLLRQEKTLTLFLSQRATDVTTKDGRIGSVRLRHIRTGEECVVKAKLFADCTGDAAVAERAGAETMWQPKFGAKGGLGSSTWWAASNRAEKISFPELPWACKVDKELDGITPRELKLDVIDGGGWSWETGFYRDPVKEGEEIRDTMLRGIWGWWAFAKNRSPKKANYAKMEIYQMGWVLGKRDAHRIVGDYVVTEEDLVQHRIYPDGVVDTTWFIDLHTPHGEFRTNGCEDAVEIRSYPIPYRCFYSRDIGNLFMAGKDISGTYRALASFRVQNTTGQMGSMIGKAAALCVKNGWSPRELGKDHFDVLAQTLKK